jgi:hypothetical protein
MGNATILEYRVIERNDEMKLSQRICELINEGWEPLGGVQAVFIPRGTDREFSRDAVKLYQTVVRYGAMEEKKCS